MSDHIGFIAAAYVFTAAVVAALIAWGAVDFRTQSRALAALQARLGRSE